MKAGQACPTVARATKRGSGAKKGLARTRVPVVTECMFSGDRVTRGRGDF